MSSDSVLSFWFGNENRHDPLFEHNPRLWWGGSLAVDEEIKEKFGDLTEQAHQIFSSSTDQNKINIFNSWLETPSGCIALILLLDQFPRNIHRGTKKAFDTDQAALKIARHIIHSNFYHQLSPCEKLFVCLCFEHSEKLKDVEEGIELIDDLLQNTPQKQKSLLRNQPDTFRKHYNMLLKYGRYPYRNIALNRSSTFEEMEFLSNPGKIPTFARRSMIRRQDPNNKQTNIKAEIARAGGISVSDYGPPQKTISTSHNSNLVNKRGKILIIHGFRSSGKAFAQKTSKLKQLFIQNGFSCIYAHAPHAYEFEPGSNAESEALEKFGGELPDLSHQRVWWKAHEIIKLDNNNHIKNENENESMIQKSEDEHENDASIKAETRDKLLDKSMRYVGVEQSLAYLRAEIDSKGPFVGVLGFAQGATMAALLVQHLNTLRSSSSSSSSSYSELKFGVFISGYCPRDDKFKHCFSTPGSLSHISSFHTWGLLDILIEPVRSEALFKTFQSDDQKKKQDENLKDDETDDKNQVITIASPHEGAHFVPNIWPNKNILKFVNGIFPQEQLMNDNNVDGNENDEDDISNYEMKLKERLLKLLPNYSGRPSLIRLFERNCLLIDKCFQFNTKGVKKFVMPTEVVSESSSSPTSNTIADTGGGGGNLSKKARQELNRQLAFEIEGLVIKPEEVAAEVAALLKASDSISTSSSSTSSTDLFEDENEPDVAGDINFVKLLEALAYEAIGNKCWKQIYIEKMKTTKQSTHLWSNKQTEMEAIHSNRTPHELQILDFGLMLWLQAYRINPRYMLNRQKIISNHKTNDDDGRHNNALSKLSELQGSGWPGLTRLAQLSTRSKEHGWTPIEMWQHSVIFDNDHHHNDDSGKGVEQEVSSSSKLDTLIFEISKTIGKALFCDMKRCLPDEWCHYFSGTLHGAPGGTPGEKGGNNGTVPERAAAAALKFISIRTSSSSTTEPTKEEKEENEGNDKVGGMMKIIKRDEIGWPSACAWGAPSVNKHADRECRIAHAVVLNTTKHSQRYYQLMVALRFILAHTSTRHIQQMATKEIELRNKKMQEKVNGPAYGSLLWKIKANQPLSFEVLNPEPEPVIPSTLEELEPLLSHLKTHHYLENDDNEVLNHLKAEQLSNDGGGNASKEIKRFVRGSLVPDGRLDLCKQVVGPEGVGPLCEALALPPHFKTLATAKSEDAATANDEAVIASDVGSNDGGGNTSKEIKRFVRGSLVPDGRLDLCKQVVGPEGVGPLCEALALPPHFKTLNHLTAPNQSVIEPLPFQEIQKEENKKEDQKNLFAVTKLLLGNNIVGNGGAEAIGKLIRSGRSTITTWYIAGNRIDGEGLKHVAEALAHDTQVDMLWLKRNPLKSLGACVISNLLSTNRMIHTLDLDNTAMLDDGAIVVLNSIQLNGSILKHLYLNGNGLGVKTAKIIGQLLSNNIINFDSKDEVNEYNKIFHQQSSSFSNTENNQVQDDEVKDNVKDDDNELFKNDNFDQQRNLFLFNLINDEQHQNKMINKNDEAVANHDKSKDHVCPLLSLMIGVNRFGDEGAYYIAKGLSQNNILTKLSIPSNRIGILGSKFIAKSLFHHQSLSSLSLGFNKSTAALGELGNYIQDEGAFHISKSLSYNQFLRELDLTQNGLYQKGVDYFIKVLRDENDTVDSVSSSSSSLSSPLPLPSLAKMYETRKEQVVNGGNDVDDENQQLEGFANQLLMKKHQNDKLVSLKTGSWGITRNDIAEDEIKALLLKNLNLCSPTELKAVAEVHMPKHVRDIYSVYRVA